MASAVKVAVRVRPFNSREEAEGAVLCVEMQGTMTRVFDRTTGTDKKFYFDYSYWSHSGFKKDAEGYMSKDGPGSIYADQNAVFQDLGVGVLTNAWEGYHTCLFAYGQTGSGKSYSMVGYDANKGIIPITCDEIFKRIKGAGESNVKYDVKVSMLEIYNEQVQDLLQPPTARAKGGLKVREHPMTGVFVENLSKRTVGSYEEISAAFDTGNKHRTVAATQMNATSSRAHTVLTISFTQIFHDANTGQPVNRKQSDINLVDLAGSERVDKTGATGERLQEGTNINKSLSTLGKVITALAKRADGQLRGEMVPYRESKLTRILQNALGGNSKTTMIAAISPATFNLEETLSTLRYADQVKAIKNQAIVNETPQEKLIRELKEENERLKKLVEGGGGGGGGRQIDEEARREYMAQIEELKRQKEEAEKTAQQRLDEAQVRRQQTIAREEITTPHLTNLNEDPLLTGHLKYAFKPGRNSAGKKSDRFQPDIPVNGLGVEENHCAFLNEGGVVTIEPSRSDAAKVLVNGQPLKAAQQLKHEDRIRVGNNLLFLYVDPAVERNPEINWEFAQKEANGQEMQRLLGAKEEEMQRKMMEEKAQFQQQLEDYQRRIEEMRREKEMQGESSQKQIAEKEREMEDRQKTMMEKFKQKEGELKKLEQDIGYKKRVEDELSNAFKLTNDASARAAMLGKKPRFRPEFYKKPGPDGRVGKGYENTHVRMRVILPELDDSVKLYWSPDKMEAKLADMVDMTEQYTNGVPLNEIEVESDPFAVSEEDIEAFGGGGVLGQCNLLAQTLYHLLNIDERCPVYDSKGVEVGKVHVVVNPRLEELDIEEFDSMSELVGHRMTWEFRILEAEDLPLSCSKNVFCTYDLPWHSHDTFQTEKAQGRNPRFNYQKNHDFIVTEQNSKAVMDFSIVIIVNGEAPEEVRNAAIAKLRQVLGPDAHIGRRPQEEVKTASAKPALASSDQGKSAGNPQPLAPGASNPAEKRAAQPHDPAGKPVLRQSDFIDSVGKPADPPSASPRNQVKPEEHKTSPEFKSKPSPASLQPIPDTTVTVVPGSSAPVVPVGVAPKTSNKSGCCAVF